MEVRLGGFGIQLKGWERFVTVAGIGLVVLALAQELTKPPADRTWHGLVGGVIPYDFRLPTWNRVKAAWWNPRNEAIVTNKVFGVGWDVNLGAVAHRMGVA